MRFRRLFGGGTKRDPTCYLRENGPIAYALRLFGNDPRAVLEPMFVTGLTWYWRAARRGSTPTVTRDWTELSRWSIAALVSDLDERDDAGDGLEIVILGVAPGTETAVAPESVRVWLGAFLAERPSPLQLVIRRTGEDADLIYVPQQVADPLRELLLELGIDPTRAARRAYARLGARALEGLR